MCECYEESFDKTYKKYSSIYDLNQEANYNKWDVLNEVDVFKILHTNLRFTSKLCQLIFILEFCKQT